MIFLERAKDLVLVVEQRKGMAGIQNQRPWMRMVPIRRVCEKAAIVTVQVEVSVRFDRSEHGDQHCRKYE